MTWIRIHFFRMDILGTGGKIIFITIKWKIKYKLSCMIYHNYQLFRVNELPEEFLYDPVSKSYGDPSRRPECKSSTIEFIAPQVFVCTTR